MRGFSFSADFTYENLHSLAQVRPPKNGDEGQTVEGRYTVGNFVWGDALPNSPQGFGNINGHKAAVSNQVPSNLVKGTSGAVCSAIISFP